jgi:hypothetical protein
MAPVILHDLLRTFLCLIYFTHFLFLILHFGTALFLPYMYTPTLNLFSLLLYTYPANDNLSFERYNLVLWF